MSSQTTMFPEMSATKPRRDYKKICSGPNCAQLIWMITNDNGKPQPYNIGADGKASTPHHETCVDVRLFKQRQATYRGGSKRALDSGEWDHD